MTLSDQDDTGLIEKLRAKLRQVEDERDAQARRIETMSTELERLEAALQMELEVLNPETAQAELRASRFWHAAWRNSERTSAKRAQRIIKLETWLKEHAERSKP